MQLRDTRNYSESLIDATTSFLENNKLLMCFVRVSFLQTSITSVQAMMKTMDFTARWFIAIHVTKNIIPSNFDFSFFRLGLMKILNINHGTASAKVFWLLYQIWHVIPTEHKENLLMDMLEPKRFYQFFFNWGWDMRSCFYYFYYFQLTRSMISS